MNHTTLPTTARRRTTTTLLIGAALVGGLTLAGCTAPTTPTPTTSATPSSSPSATPTATAAPAPTSEDEAVRLAEAAIERYLSVRASVNAAGGEDTTPLSAVATGNALQVAQDDAGRIASDKNTVTGQLNFEPTSGYAANLTAPDGTVIPFGSATVTGCQDGSEYKLFNPDGSAALQPTNQRNVIEFTSLWEPSTGVWLVQNVTATGATC